jgi:thioredoxin 1
MENKFVLILIIIGCLSISIQSAEKVEPAAKDTATANAKSAVVDSSQQIAEKIVNSKVPVLVDFWAVWCGPCRMLNPTIKELEKEFGKKVLFMKVNVDIHRGIAEYFSVNAIPAVFIIKDKAVVKMLPGLQPKQMYVDALNEVLTPAPTAPKATPNKPAAQ